MSAPYPPPSRPRWRARVIWAVVILALAGGLAFLVLRPHPSAQESNRALRRGPANQAMPVSSFAAETGDMPIVLKGLGTVTPLATVTVRTQIAGTLVKVGFTEGQEVKAGDFLAQIDPRPYDLQLREAEAQLARDMAQLTNAKVDAARYQTLVEQDSIARQQLDTQQALVRQYEGTVKADQATIASAKLNLVYCRITAPVGGRVGLRQVDEGNYVQTGDANGLVVITQMRPISVIFTLPEDRMPAVRRQLNAGATLPVTAYDRSGTTQLAEGRLLTVDNQVDVSTGTVKLRAEFPNADESLFPNQFVNASLLVDTLHGVTLIPTAAVQRGSLGTYVYLIRADSTVTARPVTLGPSQGERIVVTDGLKPGDVVVTDGADRLREGAKVRIPEGEAATNTAAGASDAGGPEAAGAPPAKADPAARTDPAGTARPHRRHRTTP